MNNKAEDFSKDWHEAAREISGMVFDVQTFISATFTFKQPIDPDDNHSLRLRAIDLKGETCWQFTKGPEAVNMGRSEATKALRELLATKPVDEAHVMTGDRDLHCRIAKKGRVLVSRSRNALGRDPSKNRAHNRDKDYPLTRFDATKLLLVLGIADPSGTIKPSMQAKYRQVNEFLRILDTTVDELRGIEGRPIRVFDIGCGKSYLSLSAKAYLEALRKTPVQLVCIDRNEHVIASCRRMAETLDWQESVTFIAQDIADYTPTETPDIVLSLHACDTATDESIAFGIEQSAAAILCAPCCQHELQSQLGSTGPNRAVLRNGILKERLADILTDAFRAQILRVMGYRTNVVEFIDQEATARNILIKGVRATRNGVDTSLAEYLDLRDAWHCKPYLAERLIGRGLEG